MKQLMMKGFFALQAMICDERGPPRHPNILRSNMLGWPSKPPRFEPHTDWIWKTKKTGKDPFNWVLSFDKTAHITE